MGRLRRSVSRRREGGVSALISPKVALKRNPRIPLGGSGVVVPPAPPQTMPEVNMSGGNDPVAYSKTFEGTP